MSIALQDYQNRLIAYNVIKKHPTQDDYSIYDNPHSRQYHPQNPSVSTARTDK